jgi:hypothetical protein
LRIRIEKIKSAAKAGSDADNNHLLIKSIPELYKTGNDEGQTPKMKDQLAALIANLKENLKPGKLDLKASEKLLQQIDQLDQPRQRTEPRRRHKVNIGLVFRLGKSCRITNSPELFSEDTVFWVAQIEG